MQTQVRSTKKIVPFIDIHPAEVFYRNYENQLTYYLFIRSNKDNQCLRMDSGAIVPFDDHDEVVRVKPCGYNKEMEDIIFKEEVE